jgi:hypothetical protein
LLAEKGALSVPFPALREALWKAYVLSVHPFTPLLDLHSFDRILRQGSGANEKMSLLLFHAVMLTGMRSVDIKYLSEAGYPSRKAAMHDAFEIVKVRINTTV